MYSVEASNPIEPLAPGCLTGEENVVALSSHQRLQSHKEGQELVEVGSLVVETCVVVTCLVHTSYIALYK